MIQKIETLKKITDVGIVAVVRAQNEEEAIKIAEAVVAGGIPAIEITFTVPGAHKVIEALNNRFNEDELIIGAGTVLDSETARIAILAGAKYIVSSSFDEATCRLCNRYQIPYMPGCITLKEMVVAMEAGADIIKVFPGSLVGPNFIKDVKGPMPQVSMMPTGGVSLDNVDQWIRNGVVAVGVGGKLTGGAKTGDYGQITETAKRFIEKIKVIREGMMK